MIRKYQPTDLDDVLQSWSSASAIAHPFLSAEFHAQERLNIANIYLPNAETWVWQSDNSVVGFIALIGNEVGGLFVNAKSQRTGIGHALIQHARTLHGELEVEVFKDNTIGRAFYQKTGFVLIEKKIHEQTGFKLLRLRQIITASN
jgi:putative acetyltransferase